MLSAPDALQTRVGGGPAKAPAVGVLVHEGAVVEIDTRKRVLLLPIRLRLPLRPGTAAGHGLQRSHQVGRVELAVARRLTARGRGGPVTLSRHLHSWTGMFIR